jgi:hypothetical protein
MKSKFLLFVTVFITIFIGYSCKKDQSVPSPDITGKWNWIKSQRVYPSEPETPQNTGNTKLIEFRADRTWIKFQNDVRMDSGIFSTGHGSYSHVYVYDSVVYRNNSSQILSSDYYKVFGDTLQFCAGFAGKLGGGSEFYIKK